LNQITNTSTATSTTALNIKYSNIATTGTNNIFISFSNSSAVIGSIKGTGSASVSYSTTSDRRLKDNILICDSSEHYNAIKNNDNQTYNFNYKTDDVNNIQCGFIAQSIRDVFPYCVFGEDDDYENYGTPLQVDYARVCPLLYSSLKECINQIESLKNTVSDLQDKVDNLTREVNYINNTLNL
jgi:hypothetical protein